MTIVSAKEIEILEPVGETGKPTRHRLAARVNDLNGKVLGLLSNHQPNADLLIDKLENLLKKRFNFAAVIKGEKPDVIGKCDIFVTGIGHWGCVVWSVHTSVALEKRHIPTATIATGALAAMGQQTAKALGLDSLPIVAIPHPSDLLTEDEVQEVAESIVDEIIYVLTEPAEKLEWEYKGKYSYSHIRKPEMLGSMPKRPPTVKI